MRSLTLVLVAAALAGCNSLTEPNSITITKDQVDQTQNARPTPKPMAPGGQATPGAQQPTPSPRPAAPPPAQAGGQCGG